MCRECPTLSDRKKSGALASSAAGHTTAAHREPHVQSGREARAGGTTPPLSIGSAWLLQLLVSEQTKDPRSDPLLWLTARIRDPPSRANHRRRPGSLDLSTMVAIAPTGQPFARRSVESTQTFRFRTHLRAPCRELPLLFDLKNGDGPSKSTARLEWNLHLIMEVVIPTHRAFAGIVSIDNGLHGNLLLTHFISRSRHVRPCMR